MRTFTRRIVPTVARLVRNGSERSSRRRPPIATHVFGPSVKVSNRCASPLALSLFSVATRQLMPITASSAVSSGRVASAISGCSHQTTRSLRGAIDCSARSAVWLGTRRDTHPDKMDRREKAHAGTLPQRQFRLPSKSPHRPDPQKTEYQGTPHDVARGSV